MVEATYGAVLLVVPALLVAYSPSRTHSSSPLLGQMPSNFQTVQETRVFFSLDQVQCHEKLSYLEDPLFQRQPCSFRTNLDGLLYFADSCLLLTIRDLVKLPILSVADIRPVRAKRLSRDSSLPPLLKMYTVLVLQ